MLKGLRQKYSMQQQSGLSLVELMVSLVIGMAVIAGSIQVVVNSKREFLDQNEIQFIQTNARYAVDLISKELRMAGYLGCVTSNSEFVANTISDDEDGFISLHGLRGFESGADTDSFPDSFKDLATAGTDAFIVRRASNDSELNVKTHNPASATITLWGTQSYAVGSTLMIADATCRSVGLFQVSGPAAGGSYIESNANGGSSDVSNNCTKIIKGNINCSMTCSANECGGYSKNTGGYASGSKVMEYVSHAYYIGPSTLSPGMSALKRTVLVSNGAPSLLVEEIAIGVDDMEISYGVDTNGDGSVDQFRTAAEMDLDSSGDASDTEWDQVVSAKVSLVFRSRNPVLTTNESKTLAGKNYNDKYLRQLVNSNVRIRNRG